MSFSNHFGSVSQAYAASRPCYPPQLFDWLAEQCPTHRLAWDCGTGSGQAALDLAQRFDQVMASDASAEQIAQAPRRDNIDYRVAPAEASGLPAASAELVTVAQALHWFDPDAFYAEVRRVLVPGGLIAAWSYGIVEVQGTTPNRLVQDFYHRIVGPYWPAERRHVETGYRELPFPFAPVAAPPFSMELDWSLDQLLDYLRSWSATARYRQAKGEDPVAALDRQLRPHWGAAERRVTWPLALRAGRI